MKLLGRGASKGKDAATDDKPKASAKTKSRKASAAHGGEINNGFFLLLMVVGILCAFGLMMVLSSSSVVALRDYGSSWTFFNRQLVWMALGAGALFIGLRLDYRMWRKWVPILLGVAAFLLLAVLVVGVEVSGAKRWLGAGPLRMQPSEIAKFAMLVFAADLLAKRAKHMDNYKVTLNPVLAVFAAFAILIMLEPNLGTTLILGSITASVLFLAGVSGKLLAKLAGAAALLATVLAIAEPYRRARLMSFTDPFADASAGGYQVVQSLVGIGSGGIFGVGPGESRAKWGFLPDAHTDFIYAIVGEEFGLVGALAVIALFAGFTLLGVRAAMRAPDRFGMLMAGGITAWVSVQAFLNIGAVIGILPVTGVPLPFLSQGGSSLVILMTATGVLLNIAKQGEIPKRSKAPTADA